MGVGLERYYIDRSDRRAQVSLKCAPTGVRKNRRLLELVKRLRKSCQFLRRLAFLAQTVCRTSAPLSINHSSRSRVTNILDGQPAQCSPETSRRTSACRSWI